MRGLGREALRLVTVALALAVGAVRWSRRVVSKDRGNRIETALLRSCPPQYGASRTQSRSRGCRLAGWLRIHLGACPQRCTRYQPFCLRQRYRGFPGVRCLFAGSSPQSPPTRPRGSWLPRVRLSWRGLHQRRPWCSRSALPPNRLRISCGRPAQPIRTLRSTCATRLTSG